MLYIRQVRFDIRLCDLDIPREKWLNYLQTVDPNQMPHTAVPDLDLSYLSVTLLESPD